MLARADQNMSEDRGPSLSISNRLGGHVGLRPSGDASSRAKGIDKQNSRRILGESRVKHRFVFIGALLYGSTFAVLASAAGDAPSVEEVKAAESDFNKGREAYKAGNYDEAAEYFESADGHAPNERVLELAINARDKAGHLDRAATSSELALELYPNAARIKKVAVPIVERAKAELLTIVVSCDEACNLLDGTRLVHGEAATRRVVFLTPGDHEIRASWSDDRVLTQQVTGKSGETQ